ncbi:MAG: hypothetical protein ACLRFR_04180, partial [Clostridia bacterium]
LLAGTLELDPENDPVIYTTDYGLDIHLYVANSSTNIFNIYDIPSAEIFESYAYFNYANINWVIIGKNQNLIKSSYLYNQTLIGWQTHGHYSAYSGLDDTDAAIALKEAGATNGIIYDYLDCIFANAAPSNELESYEVLCFAQNSIGASNFQDAVTGNRYYGSRLMSTINTFYLENLTALPIVPQSLTTTYSQGVDSTNITDENPAYLFPLAGVSGDSFYIPNYLTLESDVMKSIGNTWLRSGWTAGGYRFACRVYGNGKITSAGVATSNGVRPAFVLKI